MSGPNILVLLSDEHSRKHLGCYGSPIARTPNLDRLAARGVRFTDAYTPSPICVPARAALATGRNLHEIGHWCNADAYDGVLPSWHHLLREGGHRVVSIGKLHFRGGGRDHGFSEEILPMHIPDGLGDVMGLLRDEALERAGTRKLAAMAGPGESAYTRYDRRITAAALDWIKREGNRPAEKPWALFVSMVAPHFPLTAPEEFYGLYPPESLPLPKLYDPAARPLHPYLQHYGRVMAYDRHFGDEGAVRRALAGYFGLCSFMDHNVGQVLGALEEAGLEGSTRVLYASDHGDNLGARGVWGKSTMYEESVGVPLILAGPGLPRGTVRHEPASLIDVAPTLLGWAGLPAPPVLSGRALPHDDADRPILSEYHATGSERAAFMLRWRRWKLIHHVTHPPELFDLEADPEELNDMANDPAHAATLAEMGARLRALLDPEAVDRRARRRQSDLVAAAGGRDAILARGDFGFSPPPGEPHRYD